MAYILLIFVTILGLTLCSPAKHMKIISSTPPARFIKEFELGSQRTEVLSRSLKKNLTAASQINLCRCNDGNNTEVRETKNTEYSHFLHPGQAIASAYQSTRQKVQEWIVCFLNF